MLVFLASKPAPHLPTLRLDLWFLAHCWGLQQPVVSDSLASPTHCYQLGPLPEVPCAPGKTRHQHLVLQTVSLTLLFLSILHLPNLKQKLSEKVRSELNEKIR